MVDNLILNEESHIYTKDGIKIVSVSQVLKDAGLIDIRFVSPEGLIRGTYVHKAIHLYEIDSLDETTLDPLIVSYFDAYLKFRKETGYIPQASEEKIYSPTYRYAGRIDSKGIFKDKHTVVDYKTGEEFRPAGAIQLAAYQFALNEAKPKDKVKDRLIVRLDDSGDYFLPKPDYYGKNDFNVFLAALTVVNYRRKYGK